MSAFPGKPRYSHLFSSGLDFGFKRSATLCGIRADSDQFAHGDQDASCPICRGLRDELGTAGQYRNQRFAGFEAAESAAS